MDAGAKVHTWTNDEKGIIRETFDQSYSSVCRLAQRFGVTPNALSELISRMGLRVVRRRRWSPREEKRLEELLANHSVDEVVKITKRSYTAVLVKAKKLHLAKNNREGWYTEEDVAQIFGMSGKTVTNRIEKGLLTAMPHDSSRPPRKGKSAPWHISKESLIGYIRKYPEDLQGRNVDMICLVDVLAGVQTGY